MKFRDFLFIALFIAPVIYLGYLVYNPQERAAIKADKDHQGTVGYMARTIEAAVVGGLPMPYPASEIGCQGKDGFCFVQNKDGFVVYTLAASLAWKEYCHQKNTYILHSSVDNSNGIVCDDPPIPGKQKFISS